MSSPQILLYSTADGRPDIALRVGGDSVWLSQLEIAELFATTVANVNIHIRNILKDGELPKSSVIKESLITAADGKGYRTQLHRLELILAIGFRVRGPRGTQFRQWATNSFEFFSRRGAKTQRERIYQWPAKEA